MLLGSARGAPPPPALFLYSSDDQIIDATAVERMADALDALGARVTRVRWETSPHVSHLRTDRERYVASLATFLASAGIAEADAEATAPP